MPGANRKKTRRSGIMRGKLRVMSAVRATTRVFASSATDPPDARPGDASASPSDRYRRDARRLRSIHAKAPTRLHLELRELSRRHDEACMLERSMLAGASATRINSPPTVLAHAGFPGDILPYRSSPRVSGRPRAAVDWFADHVAARLDDQILRYSDRLDLLRQGARLGIDRFDANLVIAVQQHDRLSRCSRKSRRRGGPRRIAWLAILIALAVQAAIFCGAWWIYHIG